jgi:DNA end-binding protein Ku
MRDVHIPMDMLALAEHILDSEAATFDTTLFHDRYEEAVVSMLNDKRAGRPVSPPSVQSRGLPPART